MSRISLYFPGNATHSFLTGDRWDRMASEHLGLHIIGTSGVPVVTSHQGLDYEVYPWLRDTHAQYRNISVANAPFAHPLLPLTPHRHQQWEVKEVNGNVPVTFFGEFHTPVADVIPTEYFFYLRSQTTQYSIRFGTVVEDPFLGKPFPAGTVGVRFGNRIGLVLDGFEGFNKAWFAFGANPTPANLDAVMKAIETIASGTSPYVVIPIDLEQPWVGSAIGGRLYELFFAELLHRGLDTHIAPITEVMGAAREHAVTIEQPHRILTKWCSHMVQIKYLRRIDKLDPKDRAQHALYALAASSDLLSSWNRYVLRSTNPEATMITCRDEAGKEVRMSQEHNAPLQELCIAAANALEHGGKPFSARLAELPAQTGLIKAVHAWAVRMGL